MKEIQALENINAQGNRTLLKAYSQSKERNNDLLDFNEIVREQDVRAITATLTEAGIREFTFSSRMTGAVEILAEFKKQGAEIQDIVSVKGYDGELIPAVLLKIR